LKDEFHFFAEFSSSVSKRKILARFYSKGLIYYHVLRERYKMHYPQIQRENLIEISRPSFRITKKKEKFEEFNSVSGLIAACKKTKEKKNYLLHIPLKGQIISMGKKNKIIIKDLALPMAITLFIDQEQFSIPSCIKEGSIVLIREAIWLGFDSPTGQLRFAHFSLISFLADSPISYEGFPYRELNVKNQDSRLNVFKTFLTIINPVNNNILEARDLSGECKLQILPTSRIKIDEKCFFHKCILYQFEEDPEFEEDNSFSIYNITYNTSGRKTIEFVVISIQPASQPNLSDIQSVFLD
jgi:hypothetical protein